jgi:hypothetical protein
MLGFTALGEAGDAGVDAVRTLRGDPELDPYATLWLVDRGLEKEEAIRPEMAAHMLVETCAAVAAQNGPSGVVQMLSDLGPADEQAASWAACGGWIVPTSPPSCSGRRRSPGQAGRQGRPQGRLQASLLEPSGVADSYPLDERTVCPQDHHCRLYAICRAIYHPLLTKRDAMQYEDHPAPPPPRSRGPSRAVWVAAITTALLVAVAAAFLTTRSGGEAVGYLPPESSVPPTTSAPTTTTIDTETEVVARLREILRVRDVAYRQREGGLLRTIYTSDCPCLAGDGKAIKQLLKDKAIWVGASTSIRGEKLERVNERLWIVIATFDGSPFRIETESGQLIRSVEGKSEQFRFVLARSADRSKWMLGYAAPVKDN